ncbi:hypothetical protein Ancab_007251 [Ancistrocladus abbreviatus]
MAVMLHGRSDQLQLLQVPKKWKDGETSPERTKVWTEPKKLKNEKRIVPVIYYLSRNGQLEHPHFIEVPLSSSEGLFLRDVINRLNVLRGKGMATQYSWSSKRSYKNGFVWQDLEENDFIHPVHGNEYVLKGSEILETTPFYKYAEASPSWSSKKLPEITKSGEDSDFPVRNHRRRQSWSSIDVHEYKVYKTESKGEFAPKAAADASTQTEDKRRRRRPIGEDDERSEVVSAKVPEQQSTELSREEISPPPSDSSPETLESLMNAGGRPVLSTQTANQAKSDHPDRTADNCPSGRIKPSSVLMSLITCGSISLRDCGITAIKDHGFSLITHYKSRLPRGGNHAEKEVEEHGSRVGKIALKKKECFSGSLLETKKEEFIPAIKRSSSYNADRCSHLEMAEKEIEGVRAKCIPRKPKTQPPPLSTQPPATAAKEEFSTENPSVTINSTQQGGKNADVQ